MATLEGVRVGRFDRWRDEWNHSLRAGPRPLRHNRAAAFDAAWHERRSTARWSDLTTDPNDPAAIAHRARVLAEAWLPEIDDRIEFLRDRCRDRTVLDIGCVAHAVERFDGPDWLHGHLAEVAASCLGVDILPEGVAAMEAAGFDAVVHDLRPGLGGLLARGPFEVIVAGEVIEHIADLDLLFRVAAEGLTDDGELILTTPNPYAPARVAAGQRGLVWENADHVAYVFPAGVAELAERNGLVLSGATTVADAEPEPVRWTRRLKRTIRGSHWRSVGYATTEQGRQRAVGGRRRFGRLNPSLQHGPRFLGETFVYVVTRP